MEGEEKSRGGAQGEGRGGKSSSLSEKDGNTAELYCRVEQVEDKGAKEAGVIREGAGSGVTDGCGECGGESWHVDGSPSHPLPRNSGSPIPNSSSRMGFLGCECLRESNNKL